tara:strand:- start:21770 stop:23251 length:1482 start_codon:yes stop_codon:yes gene_type:complete
MNTYTVYLTSTSVTGTQELPTVELFDLTKLSLDLSQVYSGVFPNYLAINWGDDSGIEEPDITIYRNYKTDSIYPEVRDGASPVFLNNQYPHIFYPSDTALKKALTMRVNVGYITGETYKFIIPLNVRTEGYYENINDIELLNVSLLNNKDNKSIFTFLTKQDNFVIQNHSNDTIQYDTIGSINTLSSYSDTSNQSINETQSLLSAVADPAGAEDKFKFIESITDESATWKSSFWGYANRSVYDFSGTSYKATGFGDNNNITLITPRHGISVDHFNDDPKAGDTAYFYDHTTGNSVSATISAAANIGNDLRVVSFNRDLVTATASTGSAANIKLYKVPHFANEVPADNYPVVYNGGSKMFDSDHFAGYGSTDFINRLSLSRNSDNTIINSYNSIITLNIGPPGLPDFKLTNVSPALSTYNLSLSGVSSGDSGGPIFITYFEELLLLGILQRSSSNGYVGKARNFGNSDIQADISAGMEAVGNTWGYKLSTVRLS